MSFIDLHFHSTYSDGTMNPTELVSKAHQKNLVGLALTDHDTIEGVEEFLQECHRKEIIGIAGIEISSNYGSQPIHILPFPNYVMYRKEIFLFFMLLLIALIKNLQKL